MALRRRVTRPLVRTATLMWLWQHRHHLPGALRFLRDVPRRLQRGERADVVAEAMVRARLAADPRTRERDVLHSVRNGVAVINAAEPGTSAAAGIARKVRGIVDVDIGASAARTDGFGAATSAKLAE